MKTKLLYATGVLVVMGLVVFAIRLFNYWVM